MSKPPAHLTRILIIFCLLAILLGACGAARAPEPAASVEMPSGAPAQEAPPRAASETAYDSGTGSSNSAQAAERLVIKNANLTIVVDDPSKSMDHLSKMAEDMGGFVVNADLSYSQTEGGSEVPRATITIRVPAEQLDEALRRIESESSRAPLNKAINSQDVTSDYTDLQSRLRNLEATEAQLTKIMEDAKRTEDVLSVYQELSRVRGDIEVTKGQIQYYEQSARLSSISTEILANEAVQPLTIGSWQPGGVAKKAVQALISATKFLVNAGIWLVLFFLPLAILILLPLAFVIWLVRRLRRRSKGNRPVPPPAEPA